MSNDKEAFERAMGLSPVIVQDKQKTEDDASAFRRAMEVKEVVLANKPVEEQGPTAMEQIFVEPGQRFVERGEAIGKRMGESAEDFLDTSNLAALEPMRPEDIQRGTSLNSVLLQSVGSPVALAFDVVGNTIVVGATKAIGLVPDEFKEGALEFFNQAVQTDVGQEAIEALSSGAEAWEKYSEMYPDSAANFKSFFDISLGLPKRIIHEASPDLKPIKITEVGTRKTTSPLAGIDKDVYNIAYSTPKKSIEQAKLTTDPQGPFRVQKQLATPEQLEVVDELKTAGVRGNRTLQENLNSTQRYLDKLDAFILATARKRKAGVVEATRLKQLVLEEFEKIKRDKPTIFKDKASVQHLKDDYKEFLSILNKQGNTFEGLFNARRIFMEEMERKGVEAGGNRLNAAVLAAKAVRKGGNRAIFDVVPEAEDLLKRQSRILSVQDTVAIKAANEAQSALGRYIQELGLHKLVADSALSKVANAGYALGMGIIASPYVILKRAMKSTTPANIRAKVSYALKDVLGEIEKGLARTKDPVTKKNLLAQRAIVYSSFRAAGEQIIAEAEEKAQEETFVERQKKEKEERDREITESAAERQERLVAFGTRQQRMSNLGTTEDRMSSIGRGLVARTNALGPREQRMDSLFGTQ
tara:strand:+ start:398 stop:2320 length:1923 start_codon:yes stop_codon:yes gene_type:complete